MTSTSPSFSPSTFEAIEFELTGFTVQVTAGFLSAFPRINTSSEPGIASAPLAAVVREVQTGSYSAALSEPTRFLPGQLDLPCGLPSARFMPSRLAVAEALSGFLSALSKDSSLADGAAAGNFTVLADWVRSNAAGVDGVTVPGGPFSTGGATASEAIAEQLALGGVGKRTEGSGTIRDFVAFDVETANGDSGSVIQMGVAVVRGGEIKDCHSWLCRPPKGLDYFDEDNIAVHGITAADVASEPPFAEQVAKFIQVVGDMPVVAHNARFDFTALDRACRAEGIEVPKMSFACTYMWARQLQLGLANLKLPTLAKAAGSELENHHDATADAVACAEIALWLMRRQGVESVENLSTQLSLTMGSVGAGRMRNVRYDPSAGVSGATEGSSASDSAGAGANGTATPDKSRRRKNPKWDAAKTPDKIPDPNPDADPNGLLFGQRVTLTGDFAPYDKGFLWEKIAEAGANINKGVTKKTTILVAGPWDSVTSKEKRARQLRDEGQEIEIWSEKDLFNALSLSPEEDSAGTSGSGGQSAAGFGSTALAGDDGQPPF